MDVLSSEWVSEEVGLRAHSTVEQAYESGRLSLIPIVLGSAAESYVDNTLLNSSNLIEPEEENETYGSMHSYDELRGSFRDRLRRCPTEYNCLDDFWDLRNEVLNSDEILRLGTNDFAEANIDEYIREFEDLLGYEGESIINRTDARNLESEIREGVCGRSEFLEVITSSVYQDENTSGEMLPATVLAYERFSSGLDDSTTPIESWIEEEYHPQTEEPETVNEISEGEIYINFESQRDIIAHNLEVFQELDSPFMENLDYVLGDLTVAEGLSNEVIRVWSDYSDLRLGPPMYKTTAIW